MPRGKRRQLPKGWGVVRLRKVLRESHGPFTVLDAGSGRLPHWAIERVLPKSGRARVITCADPKVASRRTLVKNRPRLRAAQKSLLLEPKSAIDLLMDAKPYTFDVIRGSYLLNVLRDWRIGKTNSEAVNGFLVLCWHALKRNGRAFFLQDKPAIPEYAKLAKRNGFVVDVIELPDNVAARAPSPAVRLRSSPERRLRYMSRYYRVGPGSKKVKEAIKAGTITEAQEYAKPVMLVLRKRRKSRAEMETQEYYYGHLTPEERIGVEELETYMEIFRSDPMH